MNPTICFARRALGTNAPRGIEVVNTRLQKNRVSGAVEKHFFGLQPTWQRPAIFFVPICDENYPLLAVFS